LGINTAQAQLSAGRSKATVIADALAQLPASTQEQYNEVMADLVSTGEEGMLELVGRMHPPGDQSNETIEFAITGWTHYAANDPTAREMTANAFEKALKQPLNKEVKAFVVRQLANDRHGQQCRHTGLPAGRRLPATNRSYGTGFYQQRQGK